MDRSLGLCSGALRCFPVWSPRGSWRRWFLHEGLVWLSGTTSFAGLSGWCAVHRGVVTMNFGFLSLCRLKKRSRLTQLLWITWLTWITRVTSDPVDSRQEFPMPCSWPCQQERKKDNTDIFSLTHGGVRPKRTHDESTFDVAAKCFPTKLALRRPVNVFDTRLGRSGDPHLMHRKYRRRYFPSPGN